MKFLYASVHLNEAETVPNPQFLPLSTMELSSAAKGTTFPTPLVST